MAANQIAVYLITLTNVGNRAAITAHTKCRQIIIQEDPSVAGWPTTDWVLSDSPSGGSVVQRPAGTSWTFESLYDPRFPERAYNVGDIVGYAATVNGTTTFQQIEIGAN